MQALRIPSLDPTFNLALEEYLFESLRPGDEGYFLVWRNGPSVIVGRHQNTLEEINETFVREQHLPVVRRITGGGAVYHDSGNLNFSFLTLLKEHEKGDFAPYLKLMAEALGEVGVEAEFTSRNDLTVAGRKISGSAQRRSGNRLLHHGTMLVDLDMSMLSRALTGNPDKYRSKGVESHRSRVANLKEFLDPALDREACLRLVTDTMIRHCADGERELSAEMKAEAEALAERKYRSWAWNYGKSPAFTTRLRHRFSWGVLDCRLEVKQGVVRQCRIFGDFFSSREMKEIEKILEGCRYEAEALRAALDTLPCPVESYFAGAAQGEVKAFLSGEEKSFS